MVISKQNCRIAINTAVLYARLLFAMFVSFFATRIILKALGASDLGTVNAIGGVVSMFSFVSITLSTSCSRYFSYALGEKEENHLQQVFSQILILYVAGALLLLLLLETIGSWYVLNKLIVAEGRTEAAFVFFQLTVFTLLAGWFTVPFSAMIVSYENMALYSVLSVAEVIGKLIIAVVVFAVDDTDRLVMYGWLLLALALLNTVAHIVVVRIKYPQSRFEWYIRKNEILELLSFNGWQAFGALAWTTSDSFVNLLLNAFFGPLVNAARLIANQVQTAVGNFTQGFLTAARPQIVKTWASGDKGAFFALIKRTSKIGYFLTLFFALPLYFEAESILVWWLQSPPEHAVSFVKIILIMSVINTFSFPLVYAAQAVGRIALFTGIGSGVLLLTLPVSWLALKHGHPPEVVLWISTAIVALAALARFFLVVPISGISTKDYVTNVYGRMLVFTLFSFFPVWLIHINLPFSILRFLLSSSVAAIAMILAFYFIGLDRYERIGIRELMLSRLRKRLLINLYT